MCQCPKSGLSHFYTAVVEEESDEDECVNALSRAYPISTALRQVQRHQRKIRVNALSRAYPISTVSLKKPAKINGFQTRF